MNILSTHIITSTDPIITQKAFYENYAKFSFFDKNRENTFLQTKENENAPPLMA